MQVRGNNIHDMVGTCCAVAKSLHCSDEGSVIPYSAGHILTANPWAGLFNLFKSQCYNGNRVMCGLNEIICKKHSL